ncbi:MAG: metal ABC transporter permease [Helicobacteraceae bacterium]|jgi:zinc transport system permease protein|nr:metal ABC transporter permease [Helicobacteraceae bacterium]
MSEILSYTFVQYALIGAVLLAISCGVIGTLIVVNRIVFLSGSIAHATYGGIGIAFFFGFSPLLGAGVFGVAAAILTAFITLRNRHRADTLIGAIWAIGMAIGVLFLDFAPAFSGELMTYLFGSMVAISRADLLAFFMIDLIAVLFAAIFYRKLLALAFDADFARVKGVKVAPLWIALLVLASLSIVVAIRVVGLMMVLALLTIPVWIAEKFARTLAETFVLSGIFALVFAVVGFFISYYFNVTAGAAIVLFAALASLLAAIKKN